MILKGPAHDAATLAEPVFGSFYTFTSLQSASGST